MSLNTLQYRAGFLEEAAASGLSFINSPNNNPIASIKLCGPDFLVKEAYIANISITSDLNAALKFKCDVFSKIGNLLISHDNFDTNAAENIIAGSNIVHGLVFATGLVECYLSYSVRFDVDYFTAPAGAKDSEIFHLSPFAIEPYVGDVSALKIRTDEFNTYSVDVSSLSAGNYRLLTFKEGYNYDLQTLRDFEVPRLYLAAVAGAGLGKEPCEDVNLKANADFVTSINGAKPDDSGAITLTSINDCLALEPKNTPIDGNFGILISSHCAPCCRCADYTKAGKFLRSYATTYVKMAKEYKKLLDTYNSIAIRFKSQINCCDTHNKMNTRFKVWPQQNFMVQVQALMENNFSNAVCMCEAKLSIYADLDETITAKEDIPGPNNTTIRIEHTITAGTPLIITPMPEASYVYFKNVNPGNKVQIASPDTGRMTVSVDLIDGSMPIAAPCSDGSSNTSTPLPPNCMESCDGYLMLTAGFTIADPKFRRIMHLKELEDSTFDGINVPLTLKIDYEGTSPSNPCEECQPQTLPRVRKLIKIAPNRKSVNPCAPVRLRDITVETDEQGTKYYANFPIGAKVNVGSPGGTLLIIRKAYLAATQTWQDMDLITVNIPATTANSSIERILLQNGSSNNILSGAPADAVGVALTVTTAGENMTSECFPDPNNPIPQNINVAPSSVTYSVRLS